MDGGGGGRNGKEVAAMEGMWIKVRYQVQVRSNSHALHEVGRLK